MAWLCHLDDLDTMMVTQKISHLRVEAVSKARDVGVAPHRHCLLQVGAAA